MKFLERFTLIIYSYIILILSVILGLMVFNWLSPTTVIRIVETLITNIVVSKIILGVCIVFILLSIKCIFFDETSKEKLKATQGILFKNENGELMISKESIDNIVKKAVGKFSNVKDCNTKIEINNQSKLSVTLNLVVNEDVVIKDLATDLQLKIKEEIKTISDLDVEEINVKITNLQTSKKIKNKDEENG